MEPNPTAATKETLLDDVEKLKSDASSLKSNAFEIKADTFKIAQDVRNHAHAHVDEARQRMNDSIESVRQTFAANPLYVLGAGFAFGFFIALRLRR